MTVISQRVYSQPDVRTAHALRVSRIFVAAVAILLLAAGSRAQHITLSIDDVTGAGFGARGIRAEYQKGALSLNIGALTLGSQIWKNVKLDCASVKLERAQIACDDGVLLLAEKLPVSFSYLTDTRVLAVALKPGKDESWQLNLRPGTRGNDLSVRINGGRVSRLAAWFPGAEPKISAGMVSGTIQYGGDGKISAELALTGGAFADAKGLRAGEKVSVSLTLNATPAADHLRWDAALAWTAGEVFWQPLYVKAASQHLSVAGRLDAKRLQVDRGTLRYPGVGDVAFSGTYDLAAKKLVDGRGSAQALAVNALYEAILKPFLADSSFADLRSDGQVSAELQINEKGLQSADVRFDRLSFEDKTQRRFALFEINGNVPWRADSQTQAAITVKGGELLKMPVGAFEVPLGMNGMRFDLKQMRVPLLDGYIDLRDFVARAGDESWYWQFGGNIGGISMDKLTAALGIPVMHGTLAASLPMVRHIKSSLRVDSALNLKVFDGAIEAKNLVLLDLFGKAPRVQGDVTMRNLDLELVTRTYSFGNITGRMDARIAGLELVNWQPVKFDVRLASSAGNYPRKISQAAVQNISALGGAGAAAAVQRSMLRFFEQFGYEKLGWSCKLQNGVCEMGGIEDAPQGYVLVKGGGIPAITVMGYNRQVGWQELLDRIRRVTQSNVKPIIK